MMKKLIIGTVAVSTAALSGVAIAGLMPVAATTTVGSTSLFTGKELFKYGLRALNWTSFAINAINTTSDQIENVRSGNNLRSSADVISLGVDFASTLLIDRYLKGGGAFIKSSVSHLPSVMKWGSLTAGGLYLADSIVNNDNTSLIFGLYNIANVGIGEIFNLSMKLYFKHNALQKYPLTYSTGKKSHPFFNNKTFVTDPNRLSVYGEQYLKQNLNSFNAPRNVFDAVYNKAGPNIVLEGN